MAGDGAEPVMLSGRVRAVGSPTNGIVAGWCRLDAGDDSPMVRTREGSFEIVLDDGHVVRVDGLERFATQVIGPEQKLHGSWENLETNPIGTLIESGAPGPLVRVKLHGCVVRDGDRVFVIGQVTDTTFDEGTAHLRSAATARPGVVKALVVGVGDDAEAYARKRYEALAPRPKPRVRDETGFRISPRSIAFGALFALGAAATIAAATMPSAFTPAWWAVAVAFFAAAVATGPGFGAIPRFAPAAASGGAGTDGLAVTAVVLCVLGAFTGGIAFADSGDHGFDPATTVIGVPIVALVLCAVLAILAFVVTRPIANAIASLLPKSGTKSRWTSRHGTVTVGKACKSTMGVPCVAVCQDGSNPTYCKDVPSIRIDGGAEIDVPIEKAVWSSSITLPFPAKKSRAAGEERVIPVGAAMLVAGRLNESGSAFESGGHASLFAFGCDVGENPAAILRARRAQMRLSLALLVALVLVAAGLLATTLAGARTWFTPAPPVRSYAVRSLPNPAWVEICNTPDHVTLLSSTDDSVADVPAPFPIRLYDRSFAGPFTVSSNGWISLVANGTSSLSGRIPSTSTPNATLAPYWTDLHTRVDGICVGTVGVAPHRQWVVEFPSMYECCSDNGTQLVFEVVVDEAQPPVNNTITFVYATIQARNRQPVVGIEDGSGRRGTRDMGPFVGPRAVQYTPQR